MRAGRQILVETLLPRLRVPVPVSGEMELAQLGARDGGFRELWLEIGFGQGEHIAAQARRNSDILLIGCEPYINGVSNLLRIVDAEAIGNIFIHDDDARILLDTLPEACIGRLFLLFPDPWPKRRHHKRRIISPVNLNLLARVLADRAEIRFATDHRGYARWTLWHAINHAAFDWPAECPDDWRVRPADWPTTRYENKALTDGRSCIYLTFERRTRSVP